MYFLNIKPRINLLLFRLIYNNQIEEISIGHLVGLKKLDTLDLSGNKLYYLNLQDLENSEELVSV